MFKKDGLTIYFQSPRAGIDENLTSKLVEFILETKQTLDCAALDLRHEPVLKALKQVQDKGIKLRIGYNNGRKQSDMQTPHVNATGEKLKQYGLAISAVPVHHNSNFVHNKFLVRDGQYVWTCSANFSEGSLVLQDNHYVVIDSEKMAGYYTATFNDLIDPAHTHDGLPPVKTLAPVKFASLTIQPYFSPASGEEIENAIIGLLKGASRIRIAAFLISDEGILQALARAGQDRDFDIRGIYDPHGMKTVFQTREKDPELFWFYENDERFVAAPSHATSTTGEYDYMHNKIIVIDDRIVVIGSYNFSARSAINDENVLIIESAEVASAYTEYFNTLYDAYRGVETTLQKRTDSQFQSV